jgi:DNA-binding CsgD family transcriptional regulator
MKSSPKSWLHLQPASASASGDGNGRNGGGNGKNGVRHDQGILVLDEDCLVVAADEGATAIMRRANDLRNQAVVAGLPPDVSEALERAGSPSGRVRVGNDYYLFRTFDLSGVRDNKASIPTTALYLQKDVGISDFIEAVAIKYHLTEREQRTVEGVVLGLSSKEIAEQMDIAPSTVKSFLRTVMIKMGVSTRTAILRTVLRLDQGDAMSDRSG